LIHDPTSGQLGGQLGYVMSRFPHLPETFILREMAELRRQGWQVGLYPLIRQEQPVVHAQARSWMDEAHTAPLPEELLRFDDDNLRVPEVAWKVEVQLDDGSHVTAIQTGARRYAPGERVRLLIDADGALLL